MFLFKEILRLLAGKLMNYSEFLGKGTSQNLFKPFLIEFHLFEDDFNKLRALNDSSLPERFLPSVGTNMCRKMI